MMELAKAFEKAAELPAQNRADIYKISDSIAPKWNDPGKAIPDMYTVSKSIEPPWPVKAEGAEIKQIKTINQHLEGTTHPETGVLFVRKTVKDADGNPVEGVFPQFDSKYDVQLPKDLHQASDEKQFAECNKQLKNAVENDPDLAKQFTPEQLEQIKNGETPDGYVWHHNEETGKMQLVDSETHAQTGHTGGKSIWGGGSENR